MTRVEALELRIIIAILVLCVLIFAITIKLNNQSEKIDRLTSTIESMLEN
jgi:uncharacterized protein YoxC